MTCVSRCGNAVQPEWLRRINESQELSKEKKCRMTALFKGLVVAVLRAKPTDPIRFFESYVGDRVEDDLEMSLCRDWKMPALYDYTQDTSTVYRVDNKKVYGIYKDIRAKLDFEYHGNYTEARQKIQDTAVSDVVFGGVPKDKPWLVFTAGAMGAGKSHVIRWMSDRGYFPLPDFVQIDPDRFKEMLPEWQGYVDYDPMMAGARMRKESGYLVEIAQAKAMQMNKNVWVDGSLRDWEWYDYHLEKVRKAYPHYHIAILHVVADYDKVLQRADERGVSTGRYVPEEEIKDSFEKVPEAVNHLARHCDFIAHIENNGGEPVLVHYKSDAECTTNVAGDWEAIRTRFATNEDLSKSWSTHIDGILSSHKMVLFTKTYCSYSKELIRLLKQVTLPYPVHNVELDTLPNGGIGIQLELSRLTGIRTVPLLFCNSKLIGTCEHVKNLHKEGNLLRALCVADDCSPPLSPDHNPTPSFLNIVGNNRAHPAPSAVLSS
eukprot:TRINITY_DN2117_c0_g2_i1.p1 TRINITY_DN2117_c0_g2~~TRINITY_DN2117_c0_g2_i1.p1  ORF type:complete len:490 (+),score=98.76 TRINITY_DN2117_c0_g2_i1:679-2148(+)